MKKQIIIFGILLTFLKSNVTYGLNFNKCLAEEQVPPIIIQSVENVEYM